MTSNKAYTTTELQHMERAVRSILQSLIGQVIVCTKEDDSHNLSIGEKGRVLSYWFDQVGDRLEDFSIGVRVRLTEFAEENKTHQVPNYYDMDGIPRLKRWESACWRGEEDIYVGLNRASWCFSPSDETIPITTSGFVIYEKDLGWWRRVTSGRFVITQNPLEATIFTDESEADEVISTERSLGSDFCNAIKQLVTLQIGA